MTYPNSAWLLLSFSTSSLQLFWDVPAVGVLLADCGDRVGLRGAEVLRLHRADDGPPAGEVLVLLLEVHRAHRHGGKLHLLKPLYNIELKPRLMAVPRFG